jgi:hypothetical protein
MVFIRFVIPRSSFHLSFKRLSPLWVPKLQWDILNSVIISEFNASGLRKSSTAVDSTIDP